MNAIGGAAHEYERPRRNGGRLAVNAENGHDKNHIKPDEHPLSQPNILPFRSQVIQPQEEVNEARGIDQRARVPVQLFVVRSPVPETFHFLHVGFPVDLRVLNAKHNEGVDDNLDEEEKSHNREAASRVR